MTKLAAKIPFGKERILQNRAAKNESQTFTVGESVASCQTCQELLFLTMCPERTC